MATRESTKRAQKEHKRTQKEQSENKKVAENKSKKAKNEKPSKRKDITTIEDEMDDFDKELESNKVKEGKKLSDRQLKALPIIVSRRTKVEGCYEAGISNKQYLVWMKQPAFRAAYYKEINRRNVELGKASLEMLTDNLEYVNSVFLSILRDENETTANKINAGKVIYDIVLGNAEYESEVKALEIEIKQWKNDKEDV